MSRTHLLLILKVDTSSEAHGALALDLLPAVQLLQSDFGFVYREVSRTLSATFRPRMRDRCARASATICNNNKPTGKIDKNKKCDKLPQNVDAEPGRGPPRPGGRPGDDAEDGRRRLRESPDGRGRPRRAEPRSRTGPGRCHDGGHVLDQGGYTVDFFQA